MSEQDESYITESAESPTIKRLGDRKKEFIKVFYEILDCYNIALEESRVKKLDRLPKE